MKDHKISFCAHCLTETVTCKTCGNNACNAGVGEVDGKPCADCDSAYALFMSLDREPRLEFICHQDIRTPEKFHEIFSDVLDNVGVIGEEIKNANYPNAWRMNDIYDDLVCLMMYIDNNYYKLKM